ncbi:MAG: SDR family NAD(P)-dependent oxidoreductase, partial [Lachnospiraceae bacterium]|nr:SDR family NAD(P)-dependent oxidoreductase [Lachnospiraceae bacterium]
KRLIDRLKEEEDLRFMINNAGFGSAGEFEEDVPENDLQMIGVNVRAVHLLTHAALLQMEKKNRGTILNVASIAGLMPGGPFMATYYATKAYVVSLTSAIAQELRRKKSRIRIFALCPGPVDTNFNRVAGVKFALPGISAKTCVSEALAGMKRGSVILVPGRLMRISSVLARLLPRGFVLKLISGAQKRKLGR